MWVMLEVGGLCRDVVRMWAFSSDATRREVVIKFSSDAIRKKVTFSSDAMRREVVMLLGGKL